MLKLWSKLVFWILPSGSVARLFANSRLLKGEDESKQDAAKIFESSNIMHHDWRVCFRLPSSLPFAHLSSGCVQALCTFKCTMNSIPRSFPRVIKVIQKDNSTGTATCTEQPKRRQTTKYASSYLNLKGYPRYHQHHPPQTPTKYSKTISLSPQVAEGVPRYSKA